MDALPPVSIRYNRTEEKRDKGTGTGTLCTGRVPLRVILQFYYHIRFIIYYDTGTIRTYLSALRYNTGTCTRYRTVRYQ